MAKSITVVDDVNANTIYVHTITQDGNDDTLNGDIDDIVTTITLNDASTFSASGTVRIEEELITYTGKSGNDLTGCTRGSEESLATSHTDTTAVHEVSATVSGNLAGTAVFDYFADNADVGSAIYFSKKIYYDPGFNGIKLNIGTGISATSYTLKYEFYHKNEGIWKDVPDLTDNTNNLSTTGINWIYFRPTRWWSNVAPVLAGVTHVDRFHFRIRLSAVDILTEGGANQTDTVKIRENEINMDGGTENDPITLADIYAEDVAQGWGMISCEPHGGDYSYAMDIYTLKGIIIKGATGNVFEELNTSMVLGMPGYFTGGTIRFGTTYWSKKIGQKGSVYMLGGFNYNNTAYTGGTQKYYNCQIIYNCQPPAMYSSDFEFVGTHLMKFSGATIAHYGGQEVIYNGVTSNLIQSTYLSPTDTDFDFTNSILTGIYPYGGGSAGWRWLTARDAKFRYVYYRAGSGDDPTNVVLYDVEYDVLSKVPGTSSYAYIYIHYSLDLTIVDSTNTPIVGATVSYKDQFGNSVQSWTPAGDVAGGLSDVSASTTDANGNTGAIDILHYILDYNYNTQTLTETTYSPITVTITKSGYITKTIKYTMDTKRVEVEQLEQVKNLNLSRHVGMFTQ